MLKETEEDYKRFARLIRCHNRIEALKEKKIIRSKFIFKFVWVAFILISIFTLYLFFSFFVVASVFCTYIFLFAIYDASLTYTRDSKIFKRETYILNKLIKERNSYFRKITIHNRELTKELLIEKELGNLNKIEKNHILNIANRKNYIVIRNGTSNQKNVELLNLKYQHYSEEIINE
tara:strand:- start:934 stop:1464 length:531 start_codon:yes stop_codon:yes gene_type:complete